MDEFTFMKMTLAACFISLNVPVVSVNLDIEKQHSEKEQMNIWSQSTISHQYPVVWTLSHHTKWQGASMAHLKNVVSLRYV